MASGVVGIHHVTAMAADPVANHRFYTQTLGLRLVKKTVNFDSPDVYHLYFADHAGTPGTVMTFFPDPATRVGRPGTSEVGLTVFAVPPGSLDYWRQRLAEQGVRVVDAPEVGGAAVEFKDHDTTRLGLIEVADAPPGQPRAGVPAEHAIVGFAAVRLNVPAIAPTLSFLAEQLGMTIRHRTDRSAELLAGIGPIAQRVLLRADASPRARLGAGSVHHVAFRVADDDAQHRLMNQLHLRGISTSPVMDRQYFKSIYLQEPGGVIVEIATETPGFAVDEPLESLGQSLKLPPQFERLRQHLAQLLVPLAD